jgi:F-type H+-transporting ATPase subunit b
VDAFTDIATLVLAAAEGGQEEGGSFLVSPNVGLMLWTLIAFGVSMLILRKFAFPLIGEALDKRAATIDESLNSAVRTKEEAEQLLEEYRARLKEAREQAEDIVLRSRKAADSTMDEARSSAKEYREELLESTRKDIEAETRRALDEIRKEVADLTVVATEKVTRKSLDDADHRRLIEEALSEVDFSALAGSEERS